MNKYTLAKLLRKYPIRPNKKLGQNFLGDKNLMDKLIDALDVYPDEDVLEIGSGLGWMSHEIAKLALSVIAVETDKRLLKIARSEFGKTKNLTFVEGDFLKLDLPHILSNTRLPMKVIGNIPYYISSPILFKLLENHSLFQFAVLTLQREVAERLTAKPGSKDYGILSIFLQAQARCEKLFDLPPQVFFPEPEVVSRAVKITFPRQAPHLIHKPPLFKTVVKTAFRTRRKTIRNNLKGLLKNNRVKPWEASRIDPEVRPEQIPVEGYVALANTLATLL